MAELVSIAIISKDRPKVLIECIDDLLTKIPKNIPLMIADSSTSSEHKKDIYDYINSNEDLYKRTSLEQVDLAMGSLPAQRNICLNFCKTPYILYIDDDCFFRKDTFNLLLSFLDMHKERNVLGCRINQATTQKMSLRNLPRMSLIKWSQGSFNIDSDNIKEVDHIQGTFMCFKSDGLKSIGGFNENLIKGYAPFEDTYTVLKMAKMFNQKPLINYGICVDHSLAPRLQGGSRDLGLDPNNSYAYGRNGMITSKMHFGNLKTFFAIPFIIAFMVLRMFRPIFKSPFSIFVRIKSSIHLIFGIISGLFNVKGS